jgi:hypothetical protein
MEKSSSVVVVLCNLATDPQTDHCGGALPCFSCETAYLVVVFRYDLIQRIQQLDGILARHVGQLAEIHECVTKPG